MPKLSVYLFIPIWLLLQMSGLKALSQYPLRITCVDPDSLFTPGNLGLSTSFSSRLGCAAYIAQLPHQLEARGFAGASVDSVFYDSLEARIQLYIGGFFQWSRIMAGPGDAALLSGAGWNEKKFLHKPFEFGTFKLEEQKLLDYLENNGYPFAQISLDSIVSDSGRLSAKLRIEKGPLYHIDSVRVYGNAHISLDFLQRYLNIPDGTIYSKEKLQAISKKIIGLPYLQEENPWSLTLLGAGSVLNLYLKAKKSSQIDVLVGLLPNNSELTSNKLLVTGEATVNLKNALGNGESIGLNWQQVQVKSPRLDIYFQQPYLFRTPFGINTSFDLFKKDSSYLNIDFIFGVQYAATATRSGTVFFESSSSNLLNVDTLAIISSHQLPTQADIRSLNLGLNYTINTTNYRFNPLRGNELAFTGTVGTKMIKRNAQIEKLIDPLDSSFSFSSLYDTLPLHSYQFRVVLAGAHYFQISTATTLKLGVNAGIFQSPTEFRNEVFQIGGYRLLRGFDEESILASRYAVATLEYRLLVAQSSFLFSFADLGWAKNSVPGYALNNSYLGLGLGLAFETKAGIFNMSFALGKRDDTSLNLRQSKIHLGYVNFF
jgi:outer membrane protein assembly factor BamA